MPSKKATLFIWQSFRPKQLKLLNSTRHIAQAMNPLLKAKAPYILTVAAAFFLYQLLLLANSFGADYRLVQRLFSSAVNSNVASLAWLSSELIGEVGVILRFAGACIFLAFVAMLLFKKTFSVSLLRKSVLLEGIYYLFNLPFIIYLLTGSGGLTENLAALSYAGQMLIVTPIFLKLYLILRKTSFDAQQAGRWIALAITGFTFGLWVKHFALALYALPHFSLGDTVLMVGFVNSAVTLLLAGLIMIAAFWPVIRKTGTFNSRYFGVALILIGVYAAVFLVICALSPAYSVWVSLVDWWVIVMPVLGVSLFLEK